MPEKPQTHVLAPKRARSGADPLLTFLQKNEGVPVCISFELVDRLDSLRLRALLSAQAHWQAAGWPFATENLSPACAEGLRLLGVPDDQFCQGIAA